jgi:site-specific recombinase XerC
LCEKNAVTHNPVKGVKRPRVENYQGKTPALGDHQARGLLNAPHDATLKGKRDRASWLPYSITRCAVRSYAN